MSVQSFDNLAILFQIMQATRNLAQNMEQNANTWIAMANAQNPSVATLAQFMNDASNSYHGIINKAKTWVQNNNAQATAAVGLIGATLADLNNYVTPLVTAAQNLALADKSSYANIVAAANDNIATISSPASIFGN